MMQPRDAHDDSGDCAMMLTESSHNRHKHQQQDGTMTTNPADMALVGARKRKALRVVKHQVSSTTD